MTTPWTSSISRVDGDTVRIRGYDLEELIGGPSFTASCFLLIRGRLPTRRPRCGCSTPCSTRCSTTRC